MKSQGRWGWASRRTLRPVAEGKDGQFWALARLWRHKSPPVLQKSDSETLIVP